MAKNTLTAQKRDNSLNPRQLRRSGKLPATLYGKGIESLSLEFNGKEFINTYKKDKNAIFTIKIGKESHDSIVKKLQTETLKDDILNVEFQKVSKDVKIKVVAPLEIVGESPAVKAGGNLITNLTEIEVECLPADIPSSIEVDISGLENYEDSISLEQLNFPEDVTPTGALDTLILRVSSPEAAEEEVETAAEEGVEEVAAKEAPASEETVEE